MPLVTLQDAQARLADLVHRLLPGEEILITEDDQPVARLVSTRGPKDRHLRQLGTLKGTVLRIAPEFDAPLDDFKEYME
jgi:antitoxin (DNA-binding transcriptional repressor) of toxin-antitoxin stability system